MTLKIQGSFSIMKSYVQFSETIGELRNVLQNFQIKQAQELFSTKPLKFRNFIAPTSEHSRVKKIRRRYISRCFNVQNTISVQHFATKSCTTDVLQPEHLSWTYLREQTELVLFLIWTFAGGTIRNTCASPQAAASHYIRELFLFKGSYKSRLYGILHNFSLGGLFAY